ncbi:MAG: trypsin-like peptidase domain-containing protein, partial [Acidobacteriota bacterium]
ENLVATNRHVIDRAFRMVAVLEDGSEVTVDAVLAEDAEHDLALVRVQDGARPLPLFRGQVEVGESVAVIGSPLGLAGTLSTGVVSAYRQEGLEGGTLPGPLIQISAPISPGSSGSPVMNLDGEVIGVAVAGYSNGENLNFAVPTSLLFALESTIDPAGTPVRSLGQSAAKKRNVALGRNLLISLAVFTALIVVLRRLR